MEWRPDGTEWLADGMEWLAGGMEWLAGGIGYDCNRELQAFACVFLFLLHLQIASFCLYNHILYNFNMLAEGDNKQLLDPYRTLGIFSSGKIVLSASKPYVLTAPTATSFKVYSQQLAIKVVSPPFDGPVTYACSYNEYTYVRVQGEILKLKYHHIVDRWRVRSTAKKCSLLCFDGAVVFAEGEHVGVIDEKTGQISYQDLSLKIEGMIHPVTYVNKLLLYSKNQLVLINVSAAKVLYDFPKIKEFLLDNQAEIECAEASYLIDIVAVALTNGVIAFVNLKKDQIVFSVRQKLAAKVLSFSSEAAWMASGDQKGNVILWDLQAKRILYKFQGCLSAAIDSLIFIPGFPVLTCGSSQANSIRQLRINLEDSKILTLFRERLGMVEAVQSIKIATNSDLVLSSQNQTMYMSFHSQANNYLLPQVLDSRLPFHLIAKNFDVQLWKERTLEKSFKLHEYALLGRISMSCKYYVAATAKRVVRLGASYELDWKVPGVKHLAIHNQHSIFAITDFEIVVCDFNTNAIMQRVEKRGVNTTAVNTYGNLLALSSCEQKSIQIWDMNKIVQGRLFDIGNEEKVTCLSFSSDNRFLISSHTGGKLLVWSVIDGELYKRFNLAKDMIWHCFTPDNQFMLSVFAGQREANVWNNYLGRISSNRSQELLQFKPKIRQLAQNYRKELEEMKNKETQHESFQEGEEQTDVLDSIPDAQDTVPAYNFTDISKWMPLVFFDEIKARNTPEAQIEGKSLPFFLDFKNLTEQKKKVEQEIRKEVKQKRKKYIQEKDKHLKAAQNEIHLSSTSTPQQYIQQFVKLTTLSVAEVDYQLRIFLLSPTNGPYLFRMLLEAVKDVGLRSQLRNIIMNRVIKLMGTDLLSEEVVGLCEQLEGQIGRFVWEFKERVDRCVSIADHHLK